MRYEFRSKTADKVKISASSFGMLVNYTGLTDFSLDFVPSTVHGNRIDYRALAGSFHLIVLLQITQPLPVHLT